MTEMAAVQSPLIDPTHRVQHLFLLVGTNPLPNYVAAQLLCQQDGKVMLLHSEGGDQGERRSTKHYADFLRDVLAETRPDLTVKPHGIHEADSDLIVNRARELVRAVPDDQTIGLNYTGGTKPMAVHAYQTIAGLRPEAKFSYLDAGEQMLYIEDSKGQQLLARAIHTIPINLRQLAKLHGYQLSEPTRREPEHLSLAQAIADLYQTGEGRQQWLNWLKPDPLDSLPDPAVYPAIADIRAVMDEICGGKATPDALAAILLPHKPRLNSCRKWFKSGWLEEITLAAIVKLAAAKGIGDVGIGLKPSPAPTADGRSSSSINFEVDVAALRGHRLYLFSCIVDDERGRPTKHHLFEAYTRARQLGGDEARAALICYVQSPDSMTRELEREWQAWGQLKVFGREHLRNLPEALDRWITTPVS